MIRALIAWWNRPSPPAWSEWALIFYDCPRCRWHAAKRRWRGDETQTRCHNCGQEHPK